MKLEEVFSEWVELNGGMPQGTWLGPLCYILLIDSLKLQCAVHKFVDDTTLSELIARGVPSVMMDYVHDLLLWSEENKMKINTKKTKEMIIGTLNKNPPALLSINGMVVDRVVNFKLLGVILSDNLKWDDHVSMICAKCSSRLYFLKHLKRTCVDRKDLILFYITMIRPVLEYASPVWHSSLTKKN